VGIPQKAKRFLFLLRPPPLRTVNVGRAPVFEMEAAFVAVIWRKMKCVRFNRVEVPLRAIIKVAKLFSHFVFSPQRIHFYIVYHATFNKRKYRVCFIRCAKYRVHFACHHVDKRGFASKCNSLEYREIGGRFL
jgi:hypothetical protein